MKKLLLFNILIVVSLQLAAQQDTSATKGFKRIQGTSDSLTNQNAIYDRPFITLGKSRTAVGGYAEGNTNYFAADGVTEGFSMEMRRFNIFLYSSIHSRINFLSELEFEHGTEEISLETAILDFTANDALNFRGGILLPQIGLVNANHDSPKWEFVERPLSSTALIPTTLSEVGFGMFGKFYLGNNILSYDAYLVNGLQDGIIFNNQGRTNLESGKNPEMFGEDNNGVPMYNGRIAFANRRFGEVGLSYYGGIYNSFRIEGVPVDAKRHLDVMALDFQAAVRDLKIQGELVTVKADVPQGGIPLFGEKQIGGFVDLIYPVVKRRMLKFEKAVLNVAVRAEKVDLNVGELSAIGQNAGDEITALSGGIGFRPVPGTILRFNYRYQWNQDLIGNPLVRIGGFQVGIASYF